MLDQILRGCSNSPTKEAVIEDDEMSEAYLLKQMGFIRLKLPVKFDAASTRRMKVRMTASLNDIL